MRVSVLGGKGLLGGKLTPILRDAGHEVVVSSRNPASPEEVEADLVTGKGLERAVAEVDVVVHLVSDARQPSKTDVAGTARLLNVLGDQHLVYVSIVGVDRHPFVYYRAKYRAEQLIAASGISHSIVRATQFHDFIAYVLRAALKMPIALVPKSFIFQPVDTSEVASHLAEVVEQRQTGLQPDIAGPAVHPTEYLAETLMTAIGRERPMVNLPVPGKAARAFRDGLHTNPDRAVGTRTWEEFLEELSHG